MCECTEREQDRIDGEAATRYAADAMARTMLPEGEEWQVERLAEFLVEIGVI